MKRRPLIWLAVIAALSVIVSVQVMSSTTHPDSVIASADVPTVTPGADVLDGIVIVPQRVRGHDYPLRSTIGGIGEKLDPARFVRVHRSHIVNLDQVASIEPLDTGDARVHMKDGSNLPCSRTYRGGLKQRYGADA